MLSAMEILKKAAPLVPVFFCIDNYVGTVKLVGGRSMQPTFNARGKENNDAVVLDRWSARQFAYRRGDVVVLRSPHEPRELMTKRVVGLAGDWVRPRDNGSGVTTAALPVPRGQLWVEGDNEHASKDSNSFGTISASLVEARVCFKLWPLKEAGIVQRRELAGDRLVHRCHCETVASASQANSGPLPWHIAGNRYAGR